MQINYDKEQVKCAAWEFIEHALDLAEDDDDPRAMRLTLGYDYNGRLADLVRTELHVIRQKIRDQLAPKGC
jgi:hypothetical protein